MQSIELEQWKFIKVCKCGSRHVQRCGIIGDKQRFRCADCNKSWSLTKSLVPADIFERPIRQVRLIGCYCGCGQILLSIGEDGRPRHFVKGQSVGRREKHHNWKGGRFLDGSGYNMLHLPWIS